MFLLRYLYTSVQSAQVPHAADEFPTVISGRRVDASAFEYQQLRQSFVGRTKDDA